MIAILVVWYASGWASCACWAIKFREIRLGHVFLHACCGPVGLLIGLVTLAEDLRFPNPVLWKRRDE